MPIGFNIDLLTVGFTVAASVILGFVVFFQKTSSRTNVWFLIFTLANSGWSVFNYLNYQTHEPKVVLSLIRFVMFFASFQAFSFFMLMWVFPDEKKPIPSYIKYFLFPLALFVAFLTLTPAVFTSVNISSDLVATPVPGKGIGLFGLVAVSLVLSGIYQLLKKTKKAAIHERRPFILLLSGVIIMFSLIIFFNFILTAFAGNTRFIPLSAVFTLPFVLCTSYAIFKHHLLDVKVVSTEILTFVLAIAMLVEVIFSDSAYLLIFRSSIFLLVLAIGVLLIKSVLKEVKQREELQVLTKKLEEANDQLQALDKARAEFISIASHQLRTPPATIKWYVGAVMDGDFGPLNPELKSALERVESTNNSQISLIDDLLNASRIERGKLEFFFEMGDLSELAKTTYEQLLPQATMHKIKLVYEAPTKPLPQVMLDKEKVRQVINNFIDNAIKYSKVGQITVRIEQTSTDLVLKVSDTGRGIPKDVIPTLFEKYSRGKDSASAASGLGLGLYVAKVVIEQNQGKIWAESEGEGKGSTFAFSLPIHSNLQATSTVDLVGAQESHK